MHVLHRLIMSCCSQAYDIQTLWQQAEFKTHNDVSKKIINNLAAGQWTVLDLIADEHEETQRYIDKSTHTSEV